MNHLKFLFIVFVTGLIACHETKSENAREKVQSFIEGKYVRTFEGEYSKGNDTLIITQPGKNNNYYTIEHRSLYQKIRNKQLLPLEYKTENWTAIFNEQTHVLEEQKLGKLFSFLPKENALLNGNNKYEKIKE